MAANSKSELREVAEKEFGNLTKIVGSIDAAVAFKKRDEDTSIKVVIAHRAHWIELSQPWQLMAILDWAHFTAFVRLL